MKFVNKKLITDTSMTRNDWLKLIDESAWNLEWIDNLKLFENQRFWLGYQNGNKGKKFFDKFIKANLF